MKNEIAIIGATPNREKYANKAIRAYADKGYKVIPVNPKYAEIEGLKTLKLEKLPKTTEIISIYLRPEIFINMIDKIPKTVKKAFLNPGTESDEIINNLEEKNIQVIQACSIVVAGYSPKDF